MSRPRTGLGPAFGFGPGSLRKSKVNSPALFAAISGSTFSAASMAGPWRKPAVTVTTSSFLGAAEATLAAQFLFCKSGDQGWGGSVDFMLR
jgi:TRAP-type C4-dicarboxylate transport system permease large subunit